MTLRCGHRLFVGVRQNTSPDVIKPIVTHSAQVRAETLLLFRAKIIAQIFWIVKNFFASKKLFLKIWRRIVNGASGNFLSVLSEDLESED